MLKVLNFLKYFLGACILAIGALVPVTTFAAPQILGLLASSKPIPLACKNGICTAEISAYCLQSHRYAPDTGTAYRFSANAEISILSKSTSGKSLKLNLSKFATLKSVRGYSAVHFSIPENVLRESGVLAARISIGKFASAIPVPVKNDAHPILQVELEAYTGPMRTLAEQIASQPHPSAVIAGTMNRLLNYLKSDQLVSPGNVDEFWKKAIGKLPSSASPEGLDYAAKELAFCADISMDRKKNWLIPYDMRSCLETTHDEFTAEITSRVWKGLGPGG